MDALLQDIRYGFRTLIKNPGFTLVAVITLALGVGANTAIFSIVNTVLLRPMPYRDPNRLVKIVFNNSGIGMRNIGCSVPEFDDLRFRSGVFEDVSVVWPISVNLTGSEQPVRLEMVAASPAYFSMLGVSPQLGRVFGPQDEAQGFAEAIVISDGLWTRSFGRNEGVLGKSVRLDGDLYTIVGVLPPGFRHPGPTVAGDVDIWASSGYRADPFPTELKRNTRFLPGAIGRIKPELDLQQAQSKLDAMAASLKTDFASDYPAQSKWSIEVVPLQQSLVGDVRPMLLVLLGAVMLIILIASVNIANLLLARAAGRQREVAVRLAVGATRGRIIRQMLTEALMLSLLGGMAGVLTTASVLSFALRFVPARIPRLHEVSVDWVVVGFALVISVLTGIVFGLVPAIQSGKTDIFTSIREGSKGSGYGRKTGRMRDVLIVAELALAVVLMVGAGLLLRTFWTLVQQDPGFSSSRIVTANVWIPVPNDPKADKYAAPGAVSNFVRETLRRVGAIPGIEMAAVTSSLPATNPGFPVSLYLEDHPAESSNDLAAGLIIISPDYFKLMQATLIRGRSFNEDDQQNKPKVAIIDESTKHHYWPNEDAIGRRLKVGTNPKAQWITVVGIIKDIKHDGLDKDGVPHIYLSIDQNPVRSISLVARTSLPAAALEQQFRHEIQAVDSGLPVFGVRSMNDVIDVSLAPRKFSAELVGAFAGLALLLASVGIYGLLAFMVGQRTNEIGVRMALGATPANILRLIIGKGALLAAIGVLIGLLCAAAIAPLLASLLYGVRVIDPLVFLAVPVILTGVALLSSYIPARRATKVDPTTALRQA